MNLDFVCDEYFGQKHVPIKFAPPKKIGETWVKSSTKLFVPQDTVSFLKNEKLSSH